MTNDIIASETAGSAFMIQLLIGMLMFSIGVALSNPIVILGLFVMLASPVHIVISVERQRKNR